MIAEHPPRAENAGTTRTELRFTFSGRLGPIVGTLPRCVVVDYLATEAAKRKTTVKGQYPQAQYNLASMYANLQRSVLLRRAIIASGRVFTSRLSPQH